MAAVLKRGMDDVTRQRDYYRETAADYDAQHIDQFDEHGIALSALAGLARHYGVGSILDVGAGTGRAMLLLQERLPGVRIVGIEPVAELRAVGHARGLDSDALIDGLGDALPFADDAFDLVIQTGVLHHVPDPGRVVREMARVARFGVMLSDGNNLGQGSAVSRLAKGLLHRLGLWRAAIWISTRGRMSKWSEEDGVFYSYSLFDNLPDLAAKFPQHLLMNTQQMRGFNLRHGAPTGMIIALRPDARPVGSAD